MFLISGRDRRTDTKSGELFRQRFRRVARRNAGV